MIEEMITSSANIYGCDSVKMLGPHLFMNIIPNNFTVGTKHKIWCDWGMNHIQESQRRVGQLDMVTNG